MNMNQEDIKRLLEPFDFKDVEWKIQFTNQEKTSGMAVAYLNSRAIQSRLDFVIGATNWKNTYAPWQNNAQICGLSIYDSERNDWVTKYDGAENTDIEPVKGGLSDSFKRAACMWGIGRYLYEIGGVWVEIEQRGKSMGIKNDQYGKLATEYNKAIDKILNTTTNGKPPIVPTEQKAPDKPQEAAPKAATTPQPVNPTETKTPILEKEGEEVVNGIAAIIKTEKDGVPFFSETEKEEARQIIRVARMNDNGVAQLRNFQDFLSEQLHKRASQKAA
jgi:hypothetical protein